MDFKLIEIRLLAQKLLIISGHFSQIVKLSDIGPAVLKIYIFYKILLQ